MQWVEGSGLVKLISIRREKISTYGDKYPGPAAGSRRGLWRSSKVVIVGVSRCRRVVYLRRLKSWKVVIYVFTNHLGLVSAANTVHYCLLGWGMGGEEVGLTEPTVRVIRTPMVCVGWWWVEVRRKAGWFTTARITNYCYFFYCTRTQSASNSLKKKNSRKIHSLVCHAISQLTLLLRVPKNLLSCIKLTVKLSVHRPDVNVINKLSVNLGIFFLPDV